MTVTNEWTSESSTPESFWTTSVPPSFPEQCREHSLLFIKISLESDRKGVIFLDPGRCLGSPLIVTEDGLPPQSPTMTFCRYQVVKEHTVSWGGSSYMRWVIGNRKRGKYSEMNLRVYVGGNFLSPSYIDWHNLIFPYRAYMVMSPVNGLSMYMRVGVGTTSDHAFVCNVENDSKDAKEYAVPFKFTEEDLDNEQISVLEALSQRMGEVELQQLMESLGRVLADGEFGKQILTLWQKCKTETEKSYDYLTEQLI